MTTKNLSFVKHEDMFGTTVRMVSDDGSHDYIIAERMTGDPLARMVDLVNDGYMFRSPGIETGDWQQSLETLMGVSGDFSISVILDEHKKNSVTALITFADKNDAAIFAWSNMDVWQKWSKAQEANEQERLKDSGKPVAHVDENGNVKVKVTVTTLGS